MFAPCLAATWPGGTLKTRLGCKQLEHPEILVYGMDRPEPQAIRRGTCFSGRQTCGGSAGWDVVTMTCCRSDVSSPETQEDRRHRDVEFPSSSHTVQK